MGVPHYQSLARAFALGAFFAALFFCLLFVLAAKNRQPEPGTCQACNQVLPREKAVA